MAVTAEHAENEIEPDNEFGRFESLTRDLLKVPKTEADKQRRQDHDSPSRGVPNAREMGLNSTD